MILFVNASVRKDSRTKELCSYLLGRFDDAVSEVDLEDISFPKVDESFLESRDGYISKKDYGKKMFCHAKAFAAADVIVISAPYWDMSFPASLKQYIEQINVRGITFEYSPEGIPKGMCRAKKLYYITTSGGDFAPEYYGFGYIDSLAKGFWGIPETVLIKATGLDIIGADTEKIINDAKMRIDLLFK